MLISILIPAYNERYLVQECIHRVLAAPLPGGLRREVVVVDDGSTDGTNEILEAVARKHPRDVRLIRHPENRGKGAAIRSAIAEARGDILLIQDADLEYSPEDYPALLEPILAGEADAVFGSRFLPYKKKRALLFWHALANKVITVFSNLFTNLDLTDMETGYKVVRAPFLKHLPIRCDRFGIEPELVAKLAKQRCRIYEVPIRYAGRGYEEGKKIGGWDAMKALFVIVWFWLLDDLHKPDQVGRIILNQLSQTPNFNRWMAETLRPYLGDRVLEIGAGIGNLGGWLCHRDLYIFSDLEEYCCSYLSRRFANRANIQIRRMDLQRPDDFQELKRGVDTVLCINVLEHVDDDALALRNIRSALVPGGRLILLVPQHPWLYGSLDEALEHRRRYRRGELRRLLERCGFQVEKAFGFNRISTPAWFLNGRLLRRRVFGRIQLKLFDSFIWLFKRIDPYLGWPGQSLVFVARSRK